jgi:hypothetical protein
MSAARRRSRTRSTVQKENVMWKFLITPVAALTIGMTAKQDPAQADQAARTEIDLVDALETYFNAQPPVR